MSPADRARAASATRASVEREPAEADARERAKHKLATAAQAAVDGRLTAPEPRRLTPTERLHEVTMAAMTRPAAPPESSVSFTRNAKGVTQVEITVRDPDPSTAFDVALVLYTAARAKFPLPSGYVGAEGEPAGGAK